MDDFRRRVYSQPKVKRILELVGLVSVSWNEIELLWYLIFTCILHEPSRDKIDAIFRQLQTGAIQRQFIAALTETLPEKSPFRKRIGQLIARSHDLSGDRNAFIHGDYVLRIIEGQTGLAIAPGGDRSRKPNKMAGKKIEDELVATIDKIHKLSDDLDEFRLILIQEFLPKGKRGRPYRPEILAAMPKHIRDRLPRDLRERIAPPEFRAKDEE